MTSRLRLLPNTFDYRIKTPVEKWAMINAGVEPVVALGVTSFPVRVLGGDIAGGRRQEKKWKGSSLSCPLGTIGSVEGE